MKRTTGNCETPEKKKKIRGDAGKKPQVYQQKYKSMWESEPIFKGWLRPVIDDPLKASCFLCKIQMYAKRSVLEKHCETEKHKKNVRGTTAQKTLFQCNAKIRDSSAIDTVKRAEILWTACMAEHNIPMRVAKHIVEVAARAYPDSKIAQEVTLGKTKATGIVKNVIGKCHFEELAQQLRTTKFSVIIDESTDIGTIKTLAICVRFLDNGKNAIITRFWKLVQVFSSNEPNSAVQGATAERLYQSMIDTFKIADVPLDNIIGFASDGCNVMFGAQNSVTSRIKEQLPGVILNKCICHSLHLCASEACKNLPQECEDLARNIYAYFKHSSKRQAQLQEYQEFFETNPHKILRPSQTRWLSLKEVVDRILEQWQPLIAFFTMEAFQNNIKADQILFQLKDPSLKVYFEFMSYFLPKFTNTNKLFQSDKVVVNALDSRMTDLYRQLLMAYMDNARIRGRELKDIDPSDERMFSPLENIYLGVNVNNAFGILIKDKREICNVKQRCRSFLIAACLEIKKRYSFGDVVVPKLGLLTPRIALQANEARFNSFVELVSSLPRIIRNKNEIQRLVDLYRKLPDACFPKEWVELEVDKFWISVRDYTNLLDEQEFKELGQFALATLVFPHSSAACERVFSKINLMKTKTRNRLVTDTLNGMLLASECVQDTGCNKFNPSTKMINAMTSVNLYSTHPSSSNKNSNEEEDDEIIFDED